MSTNWKAVFLPLIISSSLFAQEAPKAIETVNEATNTKEVKADRPLDVTSSADKKQVEQKAEVMADQIPLPDSIQLPEPIAPVQLIKDVYVSISLGSGTAKYGGRDSDFDDNASKLFGDHTIIALDTGIYFPIPSEKLLIGPTFSVVSDEYGDETEDHLYMRSYLVGVSAIKHFNKSPIGGAFLRGDFGFAWQKGELSYNNGQIDESYESSMGYGYLLGAGYVFGTGSIGFKIEADLKTLVIEDNGTDTISHSSTINFGILF